MLLHIPYRIFPLGDTALTIDFGNRIDEKTNEIILSLFSAFQISDLPDMIEAVPAYSSLSIYFNLLNIKKKISTGETAFDFYRKEIEKFITAFSPSAASPGKVLKIPVCYDEEYASDLSHIAAYKNIDEEEIIRLHHSQSYRVFMIGFLPGFPYLGTLDEKISIPRKPQPQMVTEGSVAIAGQQTGIYTLSSQGGWNVIGKTPLKFFDPDLENPVVLNAGDTVEFYPIGKSEFLKLIS